MRINKILILTVLLLLLVSTASATLKDVEKDIKEKGKANIIIKMPQQKGMQIAAARMPSAALTNARSFETTNALAMQVKKDELEELKNIPGIEIYKDEIVHTMLQDTTNIVNATETWLEQINGTNLTGEGQTICIIDTGVNYSHESLGGCNPINTTLNGTPEDYNLESSHNYTSNSYEVYNVTMPGYTSISLHFTRIDTEIGYDFIRIYDENNQSIANYTGRINNFWTPSAQGDTIKVVLESDYSETDYGFKIDKVINSTNNITANWSVCPKVIDGYNFIREIEDPYDDAGHGTHVTGISAANGNIKGIAPETKIVSLKSLDAEGNGRISDIIRAVDWCVSRKEEYNISIISMSLGIGTYSNKCDDTRPEAESINAAIAQNITVVAATGNGRIYTGISAPACLENVTKVTATNKTDSFPYNYPSGDFPNRGGSFPDILAAPGVNINSTSVTGGYSTISGTSMSTPAVAGAIAILRQYFQETNIQKTPQEITALLNNTGKLIYDTQSAKNYSQINILNAINQFAPSIEVYEPNSTNITLITGINYTLNQTTTDPENRTLTFYWLHNGTINATTENHTINTTRLGTGTHNITFIAANTYHNTSIEWILTINQPLQFNTTNNITNKTWSQGHNLTNAINLSEHFYGGLENKTYTLNNASAINMTVNNDLATFIIPNSTYIGTEYVWITANDTNKTSDSNVFILNITESRAPTIMNTTTWTGSNNFTFNRGENVTIIINYTEPDNDTLNITINDTDYTTQNETQTFSKYYYDTATSCKQNHSVFLQVQDPYGKQANTTINITINNTNGYPPILLSTTNTTTLDNNTLANFTATLCDVNENNLTYYWYFNENLTQTGNSTYELNTTGLNITTHNLTLITSNNQSNTSKEWTINITQANIPVTFTTNITDYSWTQGNNKTNAFKLTDHFSDNENLTYTLMNASTITMQVTNNTASFIVPSPTYYGTEHVWISANDTETNATSNTFILTVNQQTNDDGEDDEGGSSGGGGGGAGLTIDPSEATSFSQLIPTAQDKISIKKDLKNVAISNLEITINKIKENVRISIEHLSDKPTTLTAPNKQAYAYLEIEHENLEDEDIEKATIDFFVTKEWITTNNMDPEKIKLHRYRNGWQKLTTTKKSSTTERIYYSANSPGLSVFAITGEKKEETNEITGQATQETKTEQETVQIQESETNEVEETKTEQETEQETENSDDSILIIITAAAIVIIAGGLFISMKGNSELKEGKLKKLENPKRAKETKQKKYNEKQEEDEHKLKL